MSDAERDELLAKLAKAEAMADSAIDLAFDMKTKRNFAEHDRRQAIHERDKALAALRDICQGHMDDCCCHPCRVAFFTDTEDEG